METPALIAIVIRWSASLLSILAVAGVYWRAGFRWNAVGTVLLFYLFVGPAASVAMVLASGSGVILMETQIVLSAAQAWVLPLVLLPLVFLTWPSKDLGAKDTT